MLDLRSAFPSVAIAAGSDEVAHLVRTAGCHRLDVVNFQGDLWGGSAAVLAAEAVTHEHLKPCFG